MFRRSIVSLMGAPPAKRIPNPAFLHRIQKPPADFNIDFESRNLTYPLADASLNFVIPKYGWTKRPETPRSDLPFFVERIDANDSIPVYTDIKGGKTKKVTVIRKIHGDCEALKAEIEKLVDNGEKVEIKSGKIVVHGNYLLRIKLYLTRLGF